MRQTLITTGVMVAVWLAVWGITIWRQSRRAVVSPRRQKRHAQRMAMFISLPCCLFGLSMQLLHAPNSLGTFVLAGVVLMLIISLLYKSPHTFTPREAMVNYVKDPAHCGQCEYDLTGNESGICPECGWEIPKEIPPEFRDYVPWALWWKRWEIRYVENWQKALVWSIFFTLFLFVLTAALVIAFGPPAAVPPAIVGLMWLINIGRLIAYARRCERR